MKVMTVLGPVAPENLGIVLPHEHLLNEAYAMFPSYDSTMEDEDLITREACEFKTAGGRTLVELTTIGIGRNPAGLVRLARATGLQIVMGCGWYREKVYPDYIFEKTTNQLADMLVKDITEGVDGTGIRAGVIGEIGTERNYITPAQERVFRAAARAQKATGVAISTHCTHLGELATEQLALLFEEKVDPSRIIIGHLGDRRNLDLELPVARAGAYVQIDHIGFREFQQDTQRARNVAQLIDQGFLSQILLSMDICFNSHLKYYGGKGYDYLLTRFVPLLKEAGVTDSQIQTMLVENPRRVLAY
jgi:phosphotriesterase-related protein